MKSDILTDELQLWGFENDRMVFDDGSIGAAIRITPLDVTAFSDEQRNALTGSLIQFLNSLPSGLDLQFVCDIRDGNEDEISVFETAAMHSDNGTEVDRFIRMFTFQPFGVIARAGLVGHAAVIERYKRLGNRQGGRILGQVQGLDECDFGLQIDTVSIVLQPVPKGIQFG